LYGGFYQRLIYAIEINQNNNFYSIKESLLNSVPYPLITAD